MTNSPRRSALARPNSRPLSASRITSAPGAARPATTALPRAPTRTTSKRGGIIVADVMGALGSGREASALGVVRSGGAGAMGMAGRAAWPAPPGSPEPLAASLPGARAIPVTPEGSGAKTPRQPRKTRMASTSNTAGMISFFALPPPAFRSVMLPSPRRKPHGALPKTVDWISLFASKCLVIGLQQGQSWPCQTAGEHERA